jgi:Peptidase propeptide and YPEB domain
MTTTRRTLVHAGAASLVAVAALRTTHVETLAQAGTPTPQPGTAGAQAAMEPVLRPDIDQIAAQEAALGGQTGVAVDSVKLQRAEGGLRYEVELSNGAEVFVDAATGQVLPMTDDDEDEDEDEDEEEDEED